MKKLSILLISILSVGSVYAKCTDFTGNYKLEEKCSPQYKNLLMPRKDGYTSFLKVGDTLTIEQTGCKELDLAYDTKEYGITYVNFHNNDPGVKIKINSSLYINRTHKELFLYTKTKIIIDKTEDGLTVNFDQFDWSMYQVGGQKNIGACKLKKIENL